MKKCLLAKKEWASECRFVNRFRIPTRKDDVVNPMNWRPALAAAALWSLAGALPALAQAEDTLSNQEIVGLVGDAVFNKPRDMTTPDVKLLQHLRAIRCHQLRAV